MKSNVFSFEQLRTVKGIRYKVIQAYGGALCLGSVTSADILEWMEQNDREKAENVKQRVAGIRLLVKCLVQPTKWNEAGEVIDGDRVPEAEFETFVEAFKQKSADENGKAIAEALELNGMGVSAKKLVAEKNASGGASNVASPTA